MRRTAKWVLIVTCLVLVWLAIGLLTMTDPSTGLHPDPNRSELVPSGAPEVGPAVNP